MSKTPLVNEYNNFNYNNEYIPTYNIFNVNSGQKVGIGTFNPKEIFDVNGSMKITGNLIISNNWNIDKYDNLSDKDIHVLYKNKVDNSVDIGRLIYASPNEKYRQFNWYREDDGLYLNTFDDRPNTIIEYKSSIYNIGLSTDYVIDIVSSSKVNILAVIFIDNNSDELITDVDNIRVNEKLLNNINGINYIEPEIVEPNKIKRFIFSNISNDKSKRIQLLGRYDFDAGSFWFNKPETNNIFTNKSLSIYSSDNYGSTVYVKGNVSVGDSIKADKIDSNIYITNNVDCSGLLKVDNIESDLNLVMNVNKLLIGNSNSDTNNLCNIGNNVSITDAGNFKIESLYTDNTIDVSDIIHSETKSFINMDNSIKIGYNINGQNCDVIESDSYKTNLYGNVFLTNNDDINFGINKSIIGGDVNIDSNIEYDRIYYNNKLNLLGDFPNTRIDTLTNTGLGELGDYLIGNKVRTENFESDVVELKPLSDIKSDKIGTIFYDKSVSKIRGIIKNEIIDFSKAFTNFDLKDNNIVVADTIDTDVLNTVNINLKYLDTDEVRTGIIKLPIHSIKANGFSIVSDLGSMRFNDSICEINDGNIWHSLQFGEFDDITAIYKIETYYNKYKLDNSFINVIPYRQTCKVLNIDNLSGSCIIEPTDIIDENTFIIKNNKLYNNTEMELPLTIINIVKNGTNYNANIIFDKKLDDINSPYVKITKITGSFNFADNYNSDVMNLSDYINNNMNKVYNIFNNKLMIGDIDTKIKIIKKEVVGDDIYVGVCVYDDVNFY